ncbi:MAG: 5-bromo-4-chloroindolyl phosphate hydrolysis family protein [Oscillospiraceae bacterium]|nr:5-bromo-4-chloroindolyl phosphate hydrolysis family protein [Oscillospiraceae bacterium]MCL2227708.1 5-bromo-4-chloroindolyl phosphate hydrolysis family protein [Oscillospiraceae bacterium]
MSQNNKKNTNEPDQTGDVISWVIIFILMFAFPPLGLILLILKMRSYAKPPGNAAKRPGANFGASTQQASSQTGAAARRYASNTARAANAARQPSPQDTKAARKKNKHLSKKSGTFISTILLLLAVILFIAGANTIFGSVIETAGAFHIDSWLNFLLGAFYIVGGFVSLFSRGIVKKRLGRYVNYCAYISERNVVPLSDLAQVAGLPVRTVKRDVQTMINSGYFDFGAYIDNELESLVLSGEAAEEIRKSARPFGDIPVKQEVATETHYMLTINELRELNRSVADVTISGKIDKIEELTGKIFRIVDEHPEKKKQVRRFETYYLPTTMKLIRSYSTLEKQGVKGENIMAAKENIGRILDALAAGYEQQLDQLFKSDAMDIAADITVLENLMQQDGLAGDKPGIKTMQGMG